MGWTVALFGGVALRSEGSLVNIGGTKQKVLVASLALRPGKVVTTEGLIDLVWGDDPPNGARRTLQASVSKLRRELGTDCPIHSASAGYRLDIDRSDVDLLLYEDTAAEAFELADVAPAPAAARLGELVENWTEPLAGLHTSDGIKALLAPFHELQRQVTERHCAALIDSGDPATAVRLLRDLTRRYSTNERYWLDLGRGLVALDRRDDALDAIQQAREALRVELGVDLSPKLAGFEVEILDGVATDVSASSSSVLRTDNLRPEPDALVSRPEVEQLLTTLSAGTVVSLVGPGGIGKTRCARAVGHRSVADGAWNDGVWLVDLASLSADEHDIAPAVSIAIGAGRQGSATTTRSVTDYLRGREVLLILDNCEHVRIAVQVFVADLFDQPSNVAVLATTRVRLGLPAERTVTLGPLSLPAARRLFDARVAEAGLGRFAVEDVEGLCAALDCYPLAVELAAARTRTFAPREILERLRRHPGWAGNRSGLVSAPDAIDSRHESLALALDWSLAQLGTRARVTLDRVAVFPSDFDLAAAESILAVEGGSDAELLDVLGVLVEHHLLVRDHSRERFRMLEPIRQVLLTDDDQRHEVMRRHGEYYLQEASRIGSGVFGRDEALWWDRLDLERSNLRDAVRWAAANGEATRLETAMDSMALLVLEGGDIGPGEWAQNALSSLGAELADVPNTSLAAAAGWALAMRVAECDAALRTLDRELTDPRLRSIMYLVMAHHNPPQAPRWTDAMLEAARDADDQLLVALARVRGLHADAITLADQHGNTSMRSTARLYTYATLPSADQPHSLHLVDECWRLALASNNQLALIQAGSARGTSLSRAGDVERGAPFLLDALERAVRRRATQLVWTVIEVVAGLLVIMEREPETSAVLWAAVDASDLTPFTRVIRDPDRPLWVEAQLSTADLDHARNIGRSLDMDAAASETRKAVERFAGS